MELHLFILTCLFLVPAILAAFSAELLRSAIALLVCSVGLTLALFNLGASLAGVFELSVCAGLITVLFVVAISLTKPLTEEKRLGKAKDHYKRFMFLPILILVVAIGLWLVREQLLSIIPVEQVQENTTVGEVLWGLRGLDLIGQIVILLVGVYGIVVLFKRGKINV